MLYFLKQGPTEKQIIMQHLHAGMPLPDAIRDAPELEEQLLVYYQAYMDLDSCRQLGMGVGPIPWLAIKQYCDELGIFGDKRDNMYYHIKALDSAYMEYRK